MNGKYNAENKYVINTEIPCYDVDYDKKLKPAAFMDLAQEIAYQAATAVGFGYDALQEKGTAWVLSRMYFEFHKYPMWRDNIKLGTWHKGAYGPFFLRDFELKNAEGETMVKGTSSWLVLDVVNRTMCRDNGIFDMIPPDSICKLSAIEKPADKVMLPRGVEPEVVGVHKVEYSDIDLLGHTNNARYLVWAMDCIDFEELKAAPVKNVTIAFNHETHAGEEIVLEKVRQVSESGAVTYFIDGKTDGKSAFCVKINL